VVYPEAWLKNLPELTAEDIGTGETKGSH